MLTILRLKSKLNYMPIPKNKELYEMVKKEANETYKKNSAFKSGYIVKLYKILGGEYIDDNKERKLKRWFKEKWQDIVNEEYPVFRPTIRINKDTPLTVNEIDPEQLKEQIKLKQKIKGKKNLPKFIGAGKDYSIIDGLRFEKSEKKNKKLKVFYNNNWIHFGDDRYQHFFDKTFLLPKSMNHNNPIRQQNYLNRASNIRDKEGNLTAYDKNSPNYYAINYLW